MFLQKRSWFHQQRIDVENYQFSQRTFVAARFVTHHRWVVCRESNVLRLINYGSCWARCSQAFVCSTALTYTHNYSHAIFGGCSHIRYFSRVCATTDVSVIYPLVRPVPLLYADAFFRLGNDHFTPDDIRLNKVAVHWRQTGHIQNGFGAVLFPVQGPPQFFHGHVPAEALRRFASRDAFVFFLEAVVQILSLWVFHRELNQPYIAFIDNTAAQFALTKGNSSDNAVNVLTSVFWTTAAEIGAAPWFERVTSSAKHLRSCQ